MAINLFKTPIRYEAGFTPFLPFGMTASASSEPNFRYVMDLYTSANWTNFSNFNFTTRVSFPPRQNGEGIYSPTKILQSLLEINPRNVNPFEEGVDDREGAFTAYKFDYFEQFNPNYFYNEILLPSGGATTSQLFFEPGPTNSNPTSFSNFNIETGDIITIQKQNPLSQFDLQGTHSVVTTGTAGNGDFFIEIDDNLDIATLNNISESGYVINVSRQDTTINDLATLDGYYAVNNMVLQYEEYQQNKIFDYQTTTQSTQTLSPTASDTTYKGKFLTEYDFANKPVYFSDYETIDLSTYIGASGSAWHNQYTNVRRVVREYDEDLNLLRNTGQFFSTEFNTGFLDPITTPRKFTGVGPRNLGITDSNTKFYDVSFTETPAINGRITEVKTYSIIPDSCREFEVVRLTFLNKLGGYDYWNFTLVSKYKSNIERTTIREKMDYDYQMGDRGEKITGDSIEEEWEINTDWLTDDEAIFMRELVESPDVYLVMQDGKDLSGTLNRSGNYVIPIIITSNSYDYKSTLNDTQIQYTIKFVKSYKIQNNR